MTARIYPNHLAPEYPSEWGVTGRKTRGLIISNWITTVTIRDTKRSLDDRALLGIYVSRQPAKAHGPFDLGCFPAHDEAE